MPYLNQCSHGGPIQMHLVILLRMNRKVVDSPSFENVQTFYAKDVSTRPSLVSTHQHRLKEKLCKNVDTLPGQVDTRPSSQNSQFEELGQQVDTLKSRSTRDLSPRTDSSIFGTKPLKHLKEVDQVEAIVGEEFKEGPTYQIAEHRLGLHVYKLLPNSSFYKGVHLKNE
ncbi:hypothetical protein Taro_045076, partial [Colocasia esculenta]|nr:hypothetical protein [Colocasia esculenta]